jgi:hypothetical protein
MNRQTNPRPTRSPATPTATKTPARIALLASGGHSKREPCSFALTPDDVGASRLTRRSPCSRGNRSPQDEQKESFGFTETPQ